MPDTRKSIPTLGTPKGVRYLAETSDGQWYYINHAGTWQACPPLYPNLAPDWAVLVDDVENHYSSVLANRLRRVLADAQHRLSELERKNHELDVEASHWKEEFRVHNGGDRKWGWELEQLIADLLAYERERAALDGRVFCTCGIHSRSADSAYEAGRCPHQRAERALAARRPGATQDGDV